MCVHIAYKTHSEMEKIAAAAVTQSEHEVICTLKIECHVFGLSN